MTSPSSTSRSAILAALARGEAVEAVAARAGLPLDVVAAWHDRARRRGLPAPSPGALDAVAARQAIAVAVAEGAAPSEAVAGVLASAGVGGRPGGRPRAPGPSGALGSVPAADLAPSVRDRLVTIADSTISIVEIVVARELEALRAGYDPNKRSAEVAGLWARLLSTVSADYPGILSLAETKHADAIDARRDRLAKVRAALGLAPSSAPGEGALALPGPSGASGGAE